MFTHPIRVYWEDTDAGGIVFYANYLKFMERARTEWLRSLGISQQALKQETGGMFVVTDTQLKYLLPARLDDVLLVSSAVLDKGRASLKLSQEIWHSPRYLLNSLLSNKERIEAENDAKSHVHGMPLASQSMVCEGTICIAWVDALSLKPGRIPQAILEVLN
jgi:acyl-CoA thioester hydrolase